MYSPNGAKNPWTSRARNMHHIPNRWTRTTAISTHRRSATKPWTKTSANPRSSALPSVADEAIAATTGVTIAGADAVEAAPLEAVPVADLAWDDPAWDDPSRSFRT